LLLYSEQIKEKIYS